MLADTFSPTEIRSFGKLMSSHCFDAIVIQQPLHTEETYSWSEFPTVLQKESELISSRPRKAAEDELPKSSSRSPSPSLAKSTHDVRKDPTIEVSAQDSNSKQSTKKTVRFAPVPQVRIYSLVLGDHPHCDDGLAIELGWDYSDALSMTSLENYKSIGNDNGYSGRSESRSIPISPRKSGGLRRSYLARKKLLLDVADCTNEELNQRLQEAKLSERQRARIERENYYYHLAFAGGSRRIQ